MAMLAGRKGKQSFGLQSGEIRDCAVALFLSRTHSLGWTCKSAKVLSKIHYWNSQMLTQFSASAISILSLMATFF
jgi:hypothetical protein